MLFAIFVSRVQHKIRIDFKIFFVHDVVYNSFFFVDCSYIGKISVYPSLYLIQSYHSHFIHECHSCLKDSMKKKDVCIN